MLMNTRRVMELIVLNIGLDLKVISPTLFAMMVLMALVTTTAATPILQLLTAAHPGRSLRDGYSRWPGRRRPSPWAIDVWLNAAGKRLRTAIRP